MTIWLCDRCGKQVGKDTGGAGKYEIGKTCIEPFDSVYSPSYPRTYKRTLKFCDQCAMEVEKFLDDEFSGMPSTVTAEINRRA